MDVWPIGPSPVRTKLFIRPLGPFGHPILDPIFIDKITSLSAHLSTIESADATNILPGNKRFLVYSKQPIERRAKLILQHVEPRTGKKVGEPIILLERSDLLSGNVKIDPKGRFVLFVVDDDLLGAGLAYPALDATGHASGSPKILTELAIAGISLLRETID